MPLLVVGHQEMPVTVDGGNAYVCCVKDGLEQLLPFPAFVQQFPQLPVLLRQFLLLEPEVHAGEADG
jgi:hypothetical protein